MVYILPRTEYHPDELGADLDAIVAGVTEVFILYNNKIIGNSSNIIIKEKERDERSD